ncbi:hypothetical protein E3U26_12785 (plasmid) [Paracoccus ferrooxidans]|uniref:hypothetical protein n=1 Tax=Paracoccus versutus TaxID=34007 RepID=UPI001FB5AAED|nr:hypothetical protein [Paracoccus versutus]MCJ1902290.1 hypothetical protein [Paracoccus versutus]WGR61648.1 hypothetical protein E3U26_12785 [Paracoccus ferrooxidans]
MFSTKMTVIGGVAVLAAGAVAAISFFGAASPKAETVPSEQAGQMDMTIPSIGNRKAGSRVTRDGCVRPARPAWAVDAAPKDTYKVTLLIDLYEIGRKNAILESNSCACEVQFPSWDNAEAEFNDLIANSDGDSFIETVYAKSSEASKLNKPALDVCEQYWGRRK